MSDLITLLSMYVYHVFGLANMKLMQTAEIIGWRLKPGILTQGRTEC